MSGAPLLSRWGRLIWPFHNPLARGTDRVEAVAVLVGLIAALLLVPVMLVLGSLVRADLLAQSERDAATSHQAVAVLLRDAPVSSGGGYPTVVGAKSNVLARWTRPDGSIGTGLVPASDGLKAGAEVNIWLDQSGRLANQPVSKTDADVGGALVAITGWLAAMIVPGLALTGLHFRLAAHRSRAWDREWADVAERWNNHRP